VQTTCEDPSVRWEPYTIEQLVADFTAFVRTRATLAWVQSFCTHCTVSAPAQSVLMWCFRDLTECVVKRPRYEDLGCDLFLILLLLHIPSVTAELVDGLQLSEFLSSVFSRSLRSALKEFDFCLPAGEKKRVGKDYLVRADKITRLYHDQLIDIVAFLFAREGSRAAAYDLLVRASLASLRWDPANDHGAPVPPELYALRFSLETVLVRLALRLSLGGGFAEVDPVAPHRPGALTYASPPLAVRSVNPWVAEEHWAQYESATDILDAGLPPVDSVEDREAWERHRAARAGGPADHLLQLFFAAVQAISVGSCRALHIKVRTRGADDLRRLLVAIWTLPTRLLHMQRFSLRIFMFLLSVGGFDGNARGFATPFGRSSTSTCPTTSRSFPASCSSTTCSSRSRRTTTRDASSTSSSTCSSARSRSRDTSSRTTSTSRTPAAASRSSGSSRSSRSSTAAAAEASASSSRCRSSSARPSRPQSSSTQRPPAPAQSSRSTRRTRSARPAWACSQSGSRSATRASTF
jgi:hypothetical protein